MGKRQTKLQQNHSGMLQLSQTWTFSIRMSKKEEGGQLYRNSRKDVVDGIRGNEQSQSEDLWFLDSGCSNHMCGKKKYFSHLNENIRDLVKLGNNSSMVVMGKGNVRLQVNGITYIITDVFFVPKLKNNLLSIGQLQENRLAIVFQHGRCKVFHREKGLIMYTKMSINRMFVLHVISHPLKSACFNIITKDMVQLWHCKYRHLSFMSLKTLQKKKKMVNGLPSF